MKVTELFGSNVFTDEVMKNSLPKEVYKSLRKTIDEGEPLDSSIAGAVANAMKDWAVSKGATHYTHWFQPLTNLTASKHDSFIEPSGDKVIMQLTGKNLIVGEPDASSFPSGGTRMTSAARGYTTWDPTSPAFVKEGTLYIPTVFVSYTGETLDKKAPLLKSMTAIDAQAKRLLKLFGITCRKVATTVGPEQEYFLVDEDVYNRRKDLILTGRTLFGALPSRGQELEDHYFGVLKPRISDFMRDLDETLWSYGIFAKTKHNEVAPAQHELAPIFTNTNIAADQNQLVMETMKRVAQKHHMRCLLHEKPFDGINGSGKHNNWSMSTDTGLNLLDPGTTPAENGQFMLFFAAVIAAVDEYQDLLRLSVASAGNDHRLGANEAPPAIVSMFVGEELEEVIEALERGEKYKGKGKKVMKLGVDTLPELPKDTTDRNRTSPFAFTGNKFEFRMVGSSFSLSGPNIVINTAVADILREFADKLEKASDFNAALHELVVETIKKHRRIIFNGNNYSDEWKEEAAKRGLSDLKNSAEALPHFADEKNIALHERMNVFTRREVVTRTEIMLENYSKTIVIEALTMSEMAKRDIYPAVGAYIRSLCATLEAEKAAGVDVGAAAEKELISTLSADNASLYYKVKELDELLIAEKSIPDAAAQAKFVADKIIPVMHEVRAFADEMETKVSAKDWPFPTYGEILFSV